MGLVVQKGIKYLFGEFFKARRARNAKRRGEHPPAEGPNMNILGFLGKSTGWTTHAGGWATAVLGAIVLFGVAPEAIQAAITPGEATALLTGGLLASRLRAAQK